MYITYIYIYIYNIYNMQGTKGPSSLDLIEQAMAEIYRSRQANLAQKSKRYMEKLAKKAEKQKGGFGR